MQWAIVDGEEDVVSAIEAAGTLALGLGAPVTARASWLLAVLRNLEGRPWAVVVRDRTGGPVALALLTTTGRFRRTVTLLGHGVSDHARLLARGEEAEAVLADGLAAALRRLRRPWRLRLEQLPDGDPVLGRLAASLPLAELAAGDVCPAICFGEDRSLSRYVSRNGRTIARQGRNRLAREDPEWRIERTGDAPEIERLLPELIDVRRRRDHALGRRSDLDSAGHVAFFADAVRMLADEGRLEVGVVRVHGAIAAYLVAVRDGATLRLWDGRIDPAHAHLRVGRVLDTAMIEAALEDRSLSGIDWGRGQMQHKKQASNDEIRTAQLRAWSGRPCRAADLLASRGRAMVRDAVPVGVRRRIRSRGGLTPAS